ncbi:uncharacterized protein LOC120837632 [Ixodes scapularis]|uniref:uncharacterized protein LOC120837632 n=1 Tax=Ixodes scapularis TaxID=6945 RepID=UPI001A9DBA8E|nr:uncharacterized protein LOC120837632 [Ixodes scapularis]
MNLFPSLPTTFPYDNANVYFYGRDSEPVLKEAVLFLPFDWLVWLAMLASFSFLFITGYIITKLLNKKQANVHVLALPFAALLLQQGPPTSREIERFLSLRFILGTCALSATVLATGYKGALVSLFSNVPLTGEAITATTYKIQDTGSRLYGVGGLLFQEVEGDPTVRYKECFEPSGRIKTAKDGKDAYLIYGSGYEDADYFEDQLLGKNYIESVWDEVLTGPQTWTYSPCRNATSNLFSRAFEAGIFKHFVSLANHKRFGTREFKMPRALTDEEPITVSDLRPCFVLWVGGIILSSTVFIIEKIVEISQGLALPRSRRRVLHG